MERIHGGRWEEYRERFGSLPVDFSVNTSPFGMPAGVKAAAAASLAYSDRYPDPECLALRRGIAERFGLDTESILCGNGAADLIDRLCLALRPKRALIMAPTFTEYRTALERVGCDVRSYPLREENDFCMDERFLDHIAPGTDVVVLCEPNNPTGQITDRALLEEIAARCDALGALLVVDECFNAFLDDPKGHSLLPALDRHRVLVLRAFTKVYAMAGLRLGWCACGDRALLVAMGAAGQPWPVSIPAQTAGLAALEEREYGKRLRALIREQRPRMLQALSRLRCRVIPGQANFLLFYDPCPDLCGGLAASGILLRDCRDFEGLGPGWYRTAIRTGDENDRLIAAIGEVHACRNV